MVEIPHDGTPVALPPNVMTNRTLAEPPSAPNHFPDETLTVAAVLPRPQVRRWPWQEWTDRTWLRALFILALVVRLGFVLLPPIWNRNLRWGDESNYDELATTLLTNGYFGYGHSGPTVFRPPLYPALMAAMYAVFGHHFGPIYVLQALCGAASAPLLARIGQRITGSLAVGMVAGVLFTFTPLLVLMTAVLYMETVYLLLLLGAVLLWLHLIRAEGLPKNWPALAIASGLLFGVGLLMRPTFQAVVPFVFFVWAWATLRRARPAALVTAIVTVSTFAVVLPWSARNARVPNGRGAFTLVSANGGLNLYQGNNDHRDAAAGGAIDIGEYPALPELNEARRDKVYQKWAVAWIKAHPGEFLRRAPVRVWRTFSPLETGNNGQVRVSAAAALLAHVGAAMFYAVALVGLSLSVRRWRAWLLPYLLIGYVIALHAISYGNSRFSLLIQPFIMLFVADALVAGWQRLRARRDVPAPKTVPS